MSPFSLKLRAVKIRWSFSLTTFFLFVAVLAAPLAYVRHSVERERRCAEFIQSIGGRVNYTYQRNQYGIVVEDAADTTTSPLLRSVFGEFYGKQVAVIELDGANITDEELLSIPWVPKVAELSLCNNNISDKAGYSIARFQSLEELRLSDTDVGDQTAIAISSLKHLRLLELSRTNVSDDGVAKLARIATLLRLRLNRCDVTNESANQLVRLSELRSLSLRGTRVADGVFAHISPMPHLAALDLGNTELSDAGLVVFSNDTFPELCQLSLFGTKCTLDGVKALRRAPREMPLDISFLRENSSNFSE